MLNTLIRGETRRNSLTPEDCGFGVTKTGIVVIVAVDVLVAAGNISVITGKGINVVVGVNEGVTDGVYVCDGVLDVPVGVWEFKPLVVVNVASSKAENFKGCGPVTTSTQARRM